MEENTTDSRAERPRLRRAHVKSKRGCRQCKIRRVKCDEAQPCCEQCVRQRIPCGFQQQQSTRRFSSSADAAKVAIQRLRPLGTSRHASGPIVGAATSPPLTPPSTESTSLSVSSPGSYDASVKHVCLTPRQLRYQDIQLRGSSTLGSLDDCLFYYYVHWCAVPSRYDETAVLSSFLPRLARGSPYLMDATLAFAATSLRISNPKNPLFVTASHGYLVRSISKQTRELTAGITRANFDGLYLTACLIAINTLTHRRFSTIRLKEDNGVAEWFYAFRGLRAITVAMPGLYLDSIVACSFPPGGWQNPFKGDIDCSEIHPDLDFMLEAVQQGCQSGGLDYESHRHALGYISRILWFPSRPLCVRFMVEARQPFIDSVARREQVALLIAGVYLSNIQFLDGLEGIIPSAEHDWSQIARFLKPSYRDLLYRGLEVVTSCHTHKESPDLSAFSGFVGVVN